MHFLTKFSIALVLPAFVPAEPYPPLATVTYTVADSTPIVSAGASFTCTPTAVWDGDGPIWCAEGPRIRIAGVAAREMDGSCRPNHPCPSVSGIDARDRLVALLGGPRGKLSTGHVKVRSGQRLANGRLVPLFGVWRPVVRRGAAGWSSALAALLAR